MATRSLTQSFNFMRNNAFQNRQLFESSSSVLQTDKQSLISSSPSRRDEHRLESGLKNDDSFSAESFAIVNEIQYDFVKIRQKMKELFSLHDQHLTRPCLDDSVEAEDRAIEAHTRELTLLFTRVHRQLHTLGTHTRRRFAQGGAKFALQQNLQQSLAKNLQELSQVFRRGQNQYLNKLKSRDERFREYFNSAEFGGGVLAGDDEYDIEAADRMWMTTDSADGLAEYKTMKYSEFSQFGGGGGEKSRNDATMAVTSGGASTGGADDDRQMMMQQMLEENSAVIAQREQEINQIVRSIHELNEIFRDIAQMVVEQGSIVDQIDYNIEQTHIKVEAGLEQLQKAQKHQQKNRKMLIILILAAINTVLFITLCATKLS